MSTPVTPAETKENWAAAYRAWAWADRYTGRSVEELHYMLETCRRAWSVYEDALKQSANGGQ